MVIIDHGVKHYTVSSRLDTILVKKGDKVIHLMMNCLEWLPLYFGILRTGAWAVPLNFRFSADDIRYCADISEGKVLILGEEFVDIYLEHNLQGLLF